MAVVRVGVVSRGVFVFPVRPDSWPSPLLQTATLLIFSVFLALASGRSHAQSLLPGLTERADYKTLARPDDVPDDAELEHQGAKVGQIYIKITNIFDMEDPDENKVLFRLANRLHIKTREDTVKNKLLFHSGAVYSGRLLAETERLLRNTGHLLDARVRPVSYDDGEVDIEVRTRDVWTLNPGILFSRSGGANTTGIVLEELNLLGMGSELKLTLKSTVDRDTTKLNYHDPNLGSSWWDLNLTYSNNSDGEGGGIALQHPFYALDTRDAYGGSVGKNLRVESHYDLGNIVDQYQADTRAARLFRGWSTGLRAGWVTRFTGGVTLNHDQFRPVAGKHPTIALPEERKLVYPWVSWARIEEDFRKDHNRDQIRKTEDLSLGWRLSASLGYATPAFGADRAAWILKGSVSKGVAASSRQTVLLRAAISGRLEHGRGENVRISESLRYYFRHSRHRLTYLSLGADYDVNPDADRQLLLGGDNGLRGYPLRYQAGEGRWLITAEQRLYTNWYPFRLFNVGAAVFADAGASWGDNLFGSAPRGVLRNVGFGFRLGNNRSALGNVVHLDFAFPLDRDDDISSFQFLVQTKRSF